MYDYINIYAHTQYLCKTKEPFSTTKTSRSMSQQIGYPVAIIQARQTLATGIGFASSPGRPTGIMKTNACRILQVHGPVPTELQPLHILSLEFQSFFFFQISPGKETSIPIKDLTPPWRIWNNEVICKFSIY